MDELELKNEMLNVALNRIIELEKLNIQLFAETSLKNHQLNSLQQKIGEQKQFIELLQTRNINQNIEFLQNNKAEKSKSSE